jgi:hypothetical protein
MGKKFLTTITLPNLSSPPSSPSVGDMYFDTTLGKIGVYTSSGWVYYLYQIEDGSVTTTKIADGAVTSSKLAPGTAVANLGYTPVNKAGDTMSGSLTVPSLLGPDNANLLISGRSYGVEIRIDEDSSGSDTFRITRGSGGSTTLMLVQNTGNVGIGTNSPTQKLDVAGNVSGVQFISTATTGTAPFQVNSTTKVNNLNADLLDGYDASTSSTANTIAVRDSSGNISANRFISTVASGTAPLQVSSNTLVTNLNADLLDGYHASFESSVNTIALRDSSGRLKAQQFFIDRKTLTITDAPKWVRFAQSPSNASNNFGLFEIRWTMSGVHGHILVAIGANFSDSNSNPNINVLSRSEYAWGLGVSKIRLLRKSTYDQMYLEVYIENGDTTRPLTLEIIQLQGYGWSMIDLVDGGVPTGYTENVITATSPFVVGKDDNNSLRLNYNGRVGIGTLSPTEKLEVNGNIKASSFISTATTGTPPLQVSSNTLVTNLNADLLDGYNSSTNSTPSTVAVRDASGNLSASSFISTASTGTAPFQISSTTKVANLNADLLDGYDSTDFARKAENATITGNWTFSATPSFGSGLRFTGGTSTWTSNGWAKVADLFKGQALVWRTGGGLSVGLGVGGSSNTIYFSSSTVDDNSAPASYPIVFDMENGRIGIGTTGPTEKIDIRTGNIRVDSSAVIKFGDRRTINVYVDHGSDTNTRYYYLGKIHSNDGILKVQGIMGGHTPSHGRANVDLQFSSRDGFRADGEVIGNIGRADIYVYAPSGDSYIYVYLVTNTWALVNLELSSVGTANIEFNGTYATSPPNLGTPIFQLSTDTSNNILWVDSNRNVKASRFISTVGTGTAPLQVSSTTKVDNLNADLLDGYDSTDFPRKNENATITGSWTFNNNINAGSVSTTIGTLTVNNNATIKGDLVVEGGSNAIAIKESSSDSTPGYLEKVSGMLQLSYTSTSPVRVYRGTTAGQADLEILKDAGSGELPIYLRFHQNSRHYESIKATNGLISFVNGNDTGYIDIQAKRVTATQDLVVAGNTIANSSGIPYAPLPALGNRGRDILVDRVAVWGDGMYPFALDLYKSDGWFTIPRYIFYGSYGQRLMGSDYARSNTTRIVRLYIVCVNNMRNIYDPTNEYWNNGHTTGKPWVRLIKLNGGTWESAIPNIDAWSESPNIRVCILEIPISVLDSYFQVALGIWWNASSPSWPTSNISGDTVPNNYQNYGADIQWTIYQVWFEIYDRY